MAGKETAQALNQKPAFSKKPRISLCGALGFAPKARLPGGES